jgi:TRAP-type mannitol/chloroaromatic compound transport system permease large subunit
VLLIVYGATAGVSVVKLYAGAFFPGLMLAALYVLYVIVVAKWKPHLAPPLPESERIVPLPPVALALSARRPNAIAGLFAGLKDASLPKRTVLGQLLIAVIPAVVITVLMAVMYVSTTAPVAVVDTSGLVETGGLVAASIDEKPAEASGVQEPPADDGGLKEPPSEGGPAASGAPAAMEAASATAAQAVAEPVAAVAAPAQDTSAPVNAAAAAVGERVPAPTWFWVVLAMGVALGVLINWLMSWQRLEVFKLLLVSFFPLAVLIIAVLGSIVFGLATPTEAAAVGGFGGVLLAGAYRYANARVTPGGSPLGRTLVELGGIVKESSFLTAKTSAMVCWLFVGSSIFSASFALLGGQELIERWVLSLGLTTLQFLLLSQFIIFILGWPLEWTEIIVIFMPIFIPLLAKFNVDPLFFGLLVALNLQTAFLSPPVAMAAFYLKGVSPRHVTLNQIFAGMMPFMGIQVLALALLYAFPAIGLWLPSVLYK